MYDIAALWLGGDNTVLFLAIAIVGIITVHWMMAQIQVSQHREQVADIRKVGNLSSQLKAVTNWYQLGINLGIPRYALLQIERDYHGNERQKQEMLDLWLRGTPNAAWRDVVSALQQMQENTEAERIRQKYIRGEIHFAQEDIGTVGIAQKNKRKMKAKFAMLVMNICKKLKEKPIDVEDLLMFLKSFFSAENLPKSSTLHEIFDEIHHQKLWDFWNYYLLEEIVQAVAADDSEIKSWIKTYKQDLKSYKITTKLFDFIAEADSDSSTVSPSKEEQQVKYNQQYYQPLSLKLKMKFTDHALTYIDELWSEYAELHGLPPYVALLDSIHKGCVSIVWLIPSHLAPRIRSTTPLSADFYHKHEITRVQLGEECIYQEEEHHKEKVHVFQEQVNMPQRQLQWTSLHTAARQGDVNTFKSITLSDINIKDKNGRTLLHIAVREGQECTVKCLIREGADVNLKDNNGLTPLHMAAKRGCSYLVDYLVVKEADINIKDNEGQTPLHIAIRGGYKDTVEYLIEQGADISTKDNDGMTPLHMAAKGGRFYLVGRFAGQDINIKDNNGRTPLHMAVREGQKHTVECLIEQGANTNMKDNDGMTPLHVAAETGGQLNIVKYLVGQRADVNIKDNKKQTPLHIAVREGNKPTVECLVIEGANIDIQDNDAMTPLHVAAERGRFHIVEYLVNKGAGKEIGRAIDIKDDNGQTALHIAARDGQERTVECFVKGGANVNIEDNNGRTPWEVADKSGHKKIAKLLRGPGSLNGRRTTNVVNELQKIKDDYQKEVQTLQEQVGVLQEQLQRTPWEVADKRGHKKIAKLLRGPCSLNWTSLHTAAGQGDVDAVKSITDKVADINVKDKNGRTPLHIAVREGHELTVKCLIMKGVDINIKDNDGRTPLHIAVRKGHMPSVEYLVDKGAKISAKDNDGMTLLHMAAERGRFYLVKVLARKEADINIKDNTGRTPLHIAVREGQKHTVECLIKEGADTNMKDNDGMTPLHVAAKRGVNSDIMKYLVDNKADINIKDNYGRTPLHMAVREGQEHAVKCLVDNKANVSIKDNDGMSPLHMAAERGRFDPIVDQLTLHDEKAINIQDNSGFYSRTPLQKMVRNLYYRSTQTPLHVAARDGQLYTVERLVENKADVNIKDKNGKTPRDMAEERYHMEIANFLTAQDPVTQDLTKLKTDTKQELAQDPVTQDLTKLKTDTKQELVLHKSKSLPKKVTETRGYLRGMDVIAETSVLVTNQSQTFHWVGYGLKLHIPQKALPANLEECKLLIKVGLSGQFALPEEMSLVSAVYWLDSEPRCTFSQPLTIEVQHCATSSQISRLTFAIARCSQSDYPYTFKILERGKFASHSTYGCIQLNHFSLIALLIRRILRKDNVKYRASVYYLKNHVTQRDIHFVITKDQEAHATVVQQKYTTKGARIGPDLSVQFESEAISLQLPPEGVTLESGWKIVPTFSPMITKERVDSFKIGELIPSCQLTAVWTKQNKPPPLIHMVMLNGAKEPFTSFTIVLSDPDSMSQAGLHSKYPAGLESQPEVADLMNEVAAETQGKWRDVGLQLGIDHGVLDGIASISPGDINHCYSNVFTRWKNQNLSKHPYTWSTVVQVLETPAVGEKRLAGKIKNKLT